MNLGSVVSDGARMQCNECGRWYRNVGIHAWRAHYLSADEYREKFELRYTQPLVSEDLSERLSIATKKVMDVERLAANRPVTTKGASRARRLQSKMDPRFIEAQKRAVTKMREGYRSAVAAGLKSSTVHMNTPDARAKATKTRASKKPEIAAKISASLKERYANNGFPARKPITEESRERMREAAKKRGISPETIRKMADTRRSRCAEMTLEQRRAMFKPKRSDPRGQVL